MAGRVMVNGRIVREMGVRATWGKDSIQVDGWEIQGPSDRVYLMMNKPFGYLCSLNDPGGRPVVTDLLKDVPQRVYYVGRLDFDSLGLLLFTNDGEFSHRLTHPKYHIPRTYKITVSGTITEKDLSSLRNGVQLEDGFSGKTNAVLVRHTGGRSIIRLTVYSGRKRMVRRMIEALGHSVVHLIRSGFGDLELGELKIGRYRYLEPKEVQSLKKKVGMV